MGFAIGRVYFVPPSAGKHFYLWMLLTVVKGARGWSDLRTFNGIEHPTYKAACLAHGLLEDDNEWNQCLTEAGEIQTGRQLHRLFATLLLFCLPTDPAELWNTHCDTLCDDVRMLLQAQNYEDPSQKDIYDYGLFLLQKILLESHKDLASFPPMPLLQKDWVMVENNLLLQEQLNYDMPELALEVEEWREWFNEKQAAAFDGIMQSVTYDHGHTFFLHSTSECGKTYVCNTIAAATHSMGKVALYVASSGTLAVLWPWRL